MIFIKLLLNLSFLLANIAFTFNIPESSIPFSPYAAYGHFGTNGNEPFFGYNPNYQIKSDGMYGLREYGLSTTESFSRYGSPRF